MMHTKYTKRYVREWVGVDGMVIGCRIFNKETKKEKKPTIQALARALPTTRCHDLPMDSIVQDGLVIRVL